MEQYNRKLIVAILLVFSYLFAGTIFFHLAEGWSFVDAFYFSGVTLTTVGYGDFVPKHDLSKIVTVFFAFSGISIVSTPSASSRATTSSRGAAPPSHLGERAATSGTRSRRRGEGRGRGLQGRHHVAQHLNELAGGQAQARLLRPHRAPPEAPLQGGKR